MVETEGHFPGRRLMQGAVSVREGERIAHWQMEGAIYHIAFHLADSVPSEQLAEWRDARQYYKSLRESRNGELTEDEAVAMRQVYDEKIERYLSSGHGCCALHDQSVAAEVGRILENRNGVEYDLHLWTIMPNHLHVIVSPVSSYEMKKIVDGWKSITAHIVAKLSDMQAPIWQRDHYSRIIRTPDEYQRQVGYVWNNPESAGLKSGFFRKRY